MPPPAGRPDGQQTRTPSAAVVLRGAGFTLAVVLGAVAVWLIVTSTTHKQLELGVLAGLWGLLLGAFCAFGTRRGQRDELTMPVPGPGQELAVRAAGYVELADESAARRHFEARLEQMLRQEIQTTLGSEIASLRDEVASLRNDLLEKVGGQLRLERIETTRVIGSDIEALQREIDQLKNGRPVVDLVDAAGPITRTIPRVIETSAVPQSAAQSAAQPVSQPVRTFTIQQAQPAPAQAQPVQPRSVLSEPDQPEPQSAQAKPAPRPQPEPAQAQPGSVLSEPNLSEPQPAQAKPAPRPQPEPAQAQPGPQPAQEQPEPPPQRPPAPPAPESAIVNGDFFADLPRLRPFTDFELDPAPSAPAVDEATESAMAQTAADEVPVLAPRRPESGRAATGRHGRADDADRSGGGGRRRRASDDEDNVLARILARESTD